MSAPEWVAGADGCPTGWLIVLKDTGGSADPRARIVGSFSDILALPEAPRIIAIDMPIGLPDRVTIGGREPDIKARRVLGKRQSSMFAMPSRSAVIASDYRAACEIALATSDPPRKIGKQTYQLFRRIREIDALMTPALQSRVFECHPEVAFWAMNSRQPLDEPKKVKSRANGPGLELRRRLLEAAGFSDHFLMTTTFRASAAGPDDFLDACACAWTAGRILTGAAITFPDVPPLDARGLRQEIKA